MAFSTFHFALALFSLVSWLLVCHAANYDILDFEMERRHEQWMAEHGRVYKDEAERAHRFELFKETVKYIEESNNDPDKRYTLGLNQFADLTMEEFKAKYIGGIDIAEIEHGRSATSSDDDDLKGPLNALPKNVDWRDKGAVTYVRDQGPCESCWALAVSQAVEGLWQIKKGMLYNLSAQQLIDCDKKNSGCKKGYIDDGFEYVVRGQGLTIEKIYPYTGINGKCSHKKERMAVADINGYKEVRPYDDERALLYRVAQQPVAALVDMFTKDIANYKSGIFHGKCSTHPNHAVLVVGYGEEKNGEKYWIIKNSWNTDWWGIKGYMKLQRDTPNNPKGKCGIATFAYYPTL